METSEASFMRRWKQQFPGVDVPKIEALSDGKSIQHKLNESEKRVSNLKGELRREEFLKDYLWNLHRKCSIVDKSNSVAPVKIYPTLGLTSVSDTQDLDSPIPLVDHDPFDENKDGLYKSTQEPVESAKGWGPRVSQRRRDGHGSVHSVGRPGVYKPTEDDSESSVIADGTLTFTPGITGAGCLTGKPDRSSGMKSIFSKVAGFGRFGKDDVVGEEESGNGNQKRSNFKVTRPAPEPPSVKRITVPTITTQTNTAGNIINDQAKAPLAKTSSTDLNQRNTELRASQRNRPPVPLPRPTVSVKGPTPKFPDSNSSPDLERKLLGSNSSINNQMEARDSSPGGSGAAIRRRPYHNYCEIEVELGSGRVGIPNLKPIVTDDDDDDSTPVYQSSTQGRQKKKRDQEYMHVTITRDNDTPVYPPEMTKSNTKAPPPMLRARGPKTTVEITDADRSRISTNSKDDDEKALYDNPIDCLIRAGVNMQGGMEPEEGSSSDEDNEPIYLNILQLKKQMLDVQQSSAIYASINVEKKNGENDGKKGNVSTSPLLTDTSDGPPVPYKSNSVRVSGEKKPLSSASSVDSIDAVFSSDTPGVWRPTEDGFRKKRGSMRAAVAETDDSRSVSSLSDEGESQGVRTLEGEKFHMRKWLMTSILDSEHSYIDMLDVLLKYMQSFEAAAKSSQPVLKQEEVDTIFFRIPDLYRIHCTFVQELEPIVENWRDDSTVGAVFKILALEEYPLSDEYCNNYAKATACLQRCSEENKQFHDIEKAIKCKGSKATLEEMLHKPVVRIQRNTLVLHDLIRFTPTGHMDYDLLQKTLKIKQNFLDNFQTPTDPDNPENQRYLVKNGMIVEMVRNQRKLRQVFLFNDVLVCAKQKLSRQRTHFECKLFIPLSNMQIVASQSKEDSKMAAGQKDKVERLKKRVSELQGEIRAELKKNKGQAEGRQWSMRAGRNMDKIRKKLTEQEVELFRESPNLLLRLRTNTKKVKELTLLMSSDYERTDWRESIMGLQCKQTPGTTSTVQGLTVLGLQNLINTIQGPNMHIGASADIAMEEEHLYGSLCVTVDRIQGLKAKADTFCCIELDSFSHFFMKAKTNIISSSSEPHWNEEFDLDLDGAQTLRILAYKMEGDSDVLLGRGALELSKTWLKGRYHETTVSLNEELSLTLSLKYTSREQTLKRTPSSAKGGLFGVKITCVTKRESRQVPMLVSTIVEEVEKRGLDEVGIYRISGLSSEIQRLKKAFERNMRGALPLARDTDTHVLACLLKLYFRELPEALFTDKLYPSFVEGLNMSDPEAKQRCMMKILRSLPEPNYTTIVYLFNHMVTISKNETVNKMSINNLATVFGPTLLRPAVQSEEPITLDLFSAGARDAMLQTGILLYFLTLMNAGGDFTKNLE